MNFNSSRDGRAFEAISKLVFTEDQDDADRTLTPGKGSALAHDVAWKSRLGYAAVGLALAAAAVVLMLWSAWSFPSLSTGHYVLPDQKVISTGPYALVRHPLYVAAFLVWFSLALAFSSVAVLLITLLYVIPSYVVYMRAEEEMLLRHLGDAYVTYRARVGMFFPRIRR